MIPIGHQTIRSFILSCPTFVLKHGDLGRTKAGFCDPCISVCFSSYIFIFWWAVLKGGG